MKELRIIIISIVLLLIVGTFQIKSQDQKNNYIKKSYFLDDVKSLTSIEYFDGLGKTSQSVNVGVTKDASGNIKDLNTFYYYDILGNLAIKYLPLPSYIDGGGDLINTQYSDQNPYYETKYDVTSRVIEEFGPGENWRSNGNKSVKHVLLTNNQADLACIKYTLNGNRRIRREGDFSSGVLMVEKTTDEDNNISYSFKNALGKQLLQRQINGEEVLDTYYIYDIFDNLCFVLPPLCADYLKGVSSTDTTTYPINSNDNLRKNAYFYLYDKFNRCIEKKLPGAGPIYLIYDNADRLRFSQDSVQRKKSIWMFNKYDNFGRTVISGYYKPVTPKNRTQLQTELDAETNICESYNSTANDLYTNLTVPTSSTTNILVNYYDTYEYYLDNKCSTCLKNGIAQMATTNTTLSSLLPVTSATNYGQMTGQKIYKLSGSGSYWKAIFHDGFHEAPFMTISDDGQADGLSLPNIEEVTMNNKGDILTKTIYHSFSTTQVLYRFNEYYTYTYDFGGRLTEIKHHIGTNPDISLIKNTYNELGQLESQSYGGTLYTQNYTYNIRNWIKTNSGPFYKEELYYEKGRNQEVGCYNGNISQTDMVYPSLFGLGASNIDLQQSEMGIFKNYNYSYDHINRLLRSTTENGSENFSETLSYDKHGNIQTLEREGIFDQVVENFGEDNNVHMCQYEKIDRLDYHYSGNQLTHVDEDWQGYGEDFDPLFTGSQNFVDNNKVSNDYFYDGNGNMISDLNKHIVTITYNLLNLPDTVQFINGNMVTYVYDATGVKRSVTRHTISNSNVSIQIGKTLKTNPTSYSITSWANTFYASNVIYTSNNITNVSQLYVAKIILPNGLLIRTNTISSVSKTFMYNHYIKDYLGNIRNVINSNGQMCQINNYYPFGMEQGEFALRSMDYQDYQFGGKEFDRKNNLNTYDFGARTYDGTIGRWSSVDPLAEKYYSISPYVYCNNNPILLIDPTGLGSRYNSYSQQYEDEDGNPVEWEVAKKEIEEKYSVTKKETISYLKGLQTSVTGLCNQVQSVAAGLFSIVSEQAQTTLPSGEQVTKYKQRDLSPDYVSASLSLDCFFVTGYGLDISLGYVRNDGLFLLGCYRQGNGFDISIAGGLSLGLYTGKTNPTGLSLSGLGAFQNIGYGNLSIGSSQNMLVDRSTLSIGSEWIFSNAAYGLGAFPQSFNLGISKTTQPLYLLKR